MILGYIAMFRPPVNLHIFNAKSGVNFLNTYEPEVGGLHRGSAFSPFLFAIMMDSLTENIRKEAPWLMLFADNVVPCAREKDVLELELDQWKEALEKR